MKINQYVLAGAAVAAYAFIGAIGYWTGKEQGTKLGLDSFHEACYTGGIVVSEKTGKAIQCGPLGLVPKEELPNFFPKGVDKI